MDTCDRACHLSACALLMFTGISIEELDAEDRARIVHYVIVVFLSTCAMLPFAGISVEELDEDSTHLCLCIDMRANVHC